MTEYLEGSNCRTVMPFGGVPCVYRACGIQGGLMRGLVRSVVAASVSRWTPDENVLLGTTTRGRWRGNSGARTMVGLQDARAGARIIDRSIACYRIHQ
jgi:hypothetical protein